MEKKDLDRLVDLRDNGMSFAQLATEFGLKDKQVARREYVKAKTGNVTKKKETLIERRFRIMTKVVKTAEKPGESIELMNERAHYRDNFERFMSHYHKLEVELDARKDPQVKESVGLDRGSERCIKVLEEWLEKKGWKSD